MQAQVKPMGIKLLQQDRDRLKRLAEIKKRSTHWLAKEAIAQYLEREESAEQLKLSAMEAWEECQQDGLHITHDEMKGWLTTWGTPNETGSPECHK
jgi:predicted transcriptional regulator